MRFSNTGGRRAWSSSTSRASGQTRSSPRRPSSFSSSVRRRRRPSLGPGSSPTGAPYRPATGQNRAMAGKVTPAVTVLTEAGIEHVLHDYDASGGAEVGFGVDAARQLGL